MGHIRQTPVERHCAELWSAILQVDTPGKKEAQMGNCLQQTGLWARQRGHFLDDWLMWEGPVHGGWYHS